MIVLKILNIRNIFFEEWPAATGHRVGGGSQQVFESGCGNVSEVRQTPIQSQKKTVESPSGRHLGNQPIKNMGTEKTELGI